MTSRLFRLCFALLVTTGFVRAEDDAAALDARSFVFARVPANDGIGSYDLWVSAFAVTNAQYIEFLNTLERDPFESVCVTPEGAVVSTLDDRIPLFVPAVSEAIEYSAKKPIGQRYHCLRILRTHPATGMSWYGAVAFANWLTAQFYNDSQACYDLTGAPSFERWKLRGAAQWLTDTITIEERKHILRLDGFRLPFCGGSNKVSEYNEWFRLAGWNGAHALRYGSGANYITGASGNYLGSEDKYEIMDIAFTTPVGYFRKPGKKDANPWGIADTVGNVWEWLGDPAVSYFPGKVMIKGGSCNSSEGDAAILCQVQYVWQKNVHFTYRYLGFRIVTTTNPFALENTRFLFSPPGRPYMTWQEN